MRVTAQLGPAHESKLVCQARPVSLVQPFAALTLTPLPSKWFPLSASSSSYPPPSVSSPPRAPSLQKRCPRPSPSSFHHQGPLRGVTVSRSGGRMPESPPACIARSPSPSYCPTARATRTDLFPPATQCHFSQRATSTAQEVRFPPIKHLAAPILKLLPPYPQISQAPPRRLSSTTLKSASMCFPLPPPARNNLLSRMIKQTLTTNITYGIPTNVTEMNGRTTCLGPFSFQSDILTTKFE